MNNMVVSRLNSNCRYYVRLIIDIFFDADLGYNNIARLVFNSGDLIDSQPEPINESYQMINLAKQWLQFT